jgi:trimeric autotransporter adhesin
MLQTTARTITFLFLFVFPFHGAFAHTYAAPANDNCGGATVLTLGVTDVNGTVKQATASSGVPMGTCTGTPDDDVWYKFILSSTTSITVTLSSIGSNLNLSGAMVQLLSGTCPSGFTSIICGDTEISAANLSSGTYYVRVYSAGSSAINSGDGFSITVAGPPSNDDCSGAITLINGVINSSGTIWNATASTAPIGTCSGNPDDDVWYKITTSTFDTSLAVNLTSIGSDLTSSGARIQILTGTCGSLTSYFCGNTAITTSIAGGTIYYIRVYSAGTGSSGTSSGAIFSITATISGMTAVTAGRTNEVFLQTTLSGSGALQYPWEITYGPDNKLWITESRGYKVYRMNPNDGTKTTVLDLNSASTDLSAWGADSLRAVSLDNTSNWNASANNWPQGGLAGLAIHPQFGDGSGHDFVYISYVHRYLYTITTPAAGGIYFRNKIVRFTYNSVTGKLGSPAVVCDTIPGGQDHNSQRMIIAPVTPGGTYYLFYAAGDMGAGQYNNRNRPENAQVVDSYEGKILRFNLDTTGNPGPNKWIPSDNPYSSASAVYSIGIRNNQGFAYDTSTNVLYGSSHGPFSDDEINIIESGKNYGHPLVIGFAADGNANGTTAGNAPGMSGGSSSTCPVITSESANATAIGPSYKDPFFSGYVNSTDFPSISTLWNTTTGGNALWPTETWSGIDIYSNKLIPGWKRSLLTAALKWGRVMRLKLSATGTGTLPNNNVNDTISYLNSKNRFRDLAIAPNGKDIFIIMDNNSATSGPGQSNPTVPQCAGCVQKYTFLGYNSDANGKSMISNAIDVTAGTLSNCQTGTTINIDNTNANLWVPITGDDGNILAEIKANGNILGTVTSSFYTKTGTVRENSSKRLFANRNITITPQTQPSSAVSIRLYLTKAEFDSLKTAKNSLGNSSNVNIIGDVSIFKNSDACGSAMTNTTTTITPQYAEAFGNNYVLQASITSFSSFYFASASTVTLPLQLLTFTAEVENNSIANLRWETTNETNVFNFIVERSTNGNNFLGIGNVTAFGSAQKNAYLFADKEAGLQQSAVLYYRLKMVDNNGQYSYSKVVTVALNKDINVFLFPNPAKHNVNVQIKGAVLNPVILQVSDLNGRIVYSEKRNIAQSGTVTIDVKQWKPQVYVLKVINSKNEVVTTQKFEKM